MIPALLTDELRPKGDVMLLLPLELLKSRLESEFLPVALLLLPPDRALRLLLLPPVRPLPPVSIQKDRGQAEAGKCV